MSIFASFLLAGVKFDIDLIFELEQIICYIYKN